MRQLALDAWQAGLSVIIAADAVGSDDPLHAAVTRRYFKARGIEFLSNGELNELFGRDANTLAHVLPSRVSEPIATAAAASRSWRDSAPAERAGMMRRLAGVLSQEIEPLAALMAEELGKPLKFGRREAESVVAMLDALAARAAEANAAAANGAGYAERRRPHGVVAAITPWNNPIYLPVGKIAPAVLYGNAVVWKPAPETRAVSRRLIECLATAGWPEGLVQLIEGGEREGMALMADTAVGAVTLTGGSLAGTPHRKFAAGAASPSRPSSAATTRPSSGPTPILRTPHTSSPPARSRWPASAAPPIAVSSCIERAREILAHVDRGDRGAQLG